MRWLILFFWLLAPIVLEADITVSPLSLTLDSKVNDGLFTASNQILTGASQYVNVDLVKWSQSDQQDVFTENKGDILMFPPVFFVPPEKSQIVRLSLINPPDAANEKTYRLIFEQFMPKTISVATSNKNSNASFTFLTTISVPVFVSSYAPKQISATFHVQNLHQNPSFLDIHNTGNTHIKVLNIILLEGSKKIAETNQGFQYVLAGATMPMLLKVYKAFYSGEKLTVKATLDDTDHPIIQENIIIN